MNELFNPRGFRRLEYGNGWNDEGQNQQKKKKKLEKIFCSKKNKSIGMALKL